MSDKVDNLKERARKMLLDGDTGDKIREETQLREKDIKRIQKDITKHF